MTPTDPLFACLSINIVIAAAWRNADTPAGLAAAALIKAALRLILLGLVVANADNWLWIVIATATTGMAEYAADRYSLKQGGACYTFNLVASMLRMASAFFVFGHMGAFPGFNPLIVKACESVAAQNTVLLSITADQVHSLLVSVSGVLIAGLEANHLIALLLQKAGLIPALSSAADAVQDIGKQMDNRKEIARGRLIGILERTLVFLLTVNDAVSALGLIIAAKALTRFKDLDEREFAEYVLIGTLLSMSSAVAIGFLLKNA